MRDKRGRFKKADDGIILNFSIPSFTKIIFWILLLALIFPWVAIISKFELFDKFISFFESIMTKTNTDVEGTKDSTKKNGLFY